MDVNRLLEAILNIVTEAQEQATTRSLNNSDLSNHNQHSSEKTDGIDYRLPPLNSENTVHGIPSTRGIIQRTDPAGTSESEYISTAWE